MKTIIKYFAFAYIGISLTQAVIGGMVFGGERNITIFLLVLALSLLNAFVSPVLGVLSLPYKGPGGLFLIFMLNLIVFYMLTILLSGFGVKDTVVSELIIFGFVLPSKSLTKTWSLVFSALLFVIVINFFKWLCTDKK